MKKEKYLYYSSCLLLLLMSATVLFMRMAVDSGKVSVRNTVGMLFWLLMVSGIVCALLSARFVQKQMESAGKSKIWKRVKPGIISVFQTLPGKTADITFAVCLALYIVFSFTQLKYSYIMFILMFLLLASFCAHCLFNGRTYRCMEALSYNTGDDE